MPDQLTRFLIENLDIRGAIVQLDECWKNICSNRHYPSPVRSMLGQMCAISTLITGNLKQKGRITFQLSSSSGPVSLLVVDCMEDLNLRAYARHSSIASTSENIQTLFPDGQLLMSLDIEGTKQPYQSYVPIEGKSIAEMFGHYLELSEQQPAWLLLMADAQHAAGLFLQKLPGADSLDADGWNRVGHLASTLTKEELFNVSPTEILTRLFSEESVRVYEPRQVKHDFPEDREKIATMLRGLGQEEVENILAEHGEILIQDDLSNHEYRFSPEEARALFGPSAPSLH